VVSALPYLHPSVQVSQSYMWPVPLALDLRIVKLLCILGAWNFVFMVHDELCMEWQGLVEIHHV
jgi:hypothetical protein